MPSGLAAGTGTCGNVIDGVGAGVAVGLLAAELGSVPAGAAGTAEPPSTVLGSTSVIASRSGKSAASCAAISSGVKPERLFGLWVMPTERGKRHASVREHSSHYCC